MKDDDRSATSNHIGKDSGDAVGEEAISVPRTLKWLIAIASGTAIFVCTWWLCARLGRSTGDAIGIAAIPSAMLTLPLAWWAGRDEKSAEPAPQNSVTGAVSGILLQARDIDEVHIHPQLTPPADEQVVVGLIPHEPPNFQLPDQVAQLAVMGGSICVVCAVTGQRGVGKTQVAAAYARQRVRDGWLVAWTGAESTDLVQAGMVNLAERLKLYRPDDDAETTAARVRDHLQTINKPALLVFDNVEKMDAIRPYLPAAGTIQVVLTSTIRGADRLGLPVPVDVFDMETSLRFLREATGLNDLSGARELAVEVGCLPLALAQAAARIRAAGWSYATYLDRFRKFPVDRYLTRRDGDSYPHGAATTILIALEPFKASELLETLAMLSPDGVSHEVLAAGRNVTSVDDELEQLSEASIVEFAGAGSLTVIIHRLVQRVIRDHRRMDGAYEKIVARERDRLGRLTIERSEAWSLRGRGDELVRQIDALWSNIDPQCHVQDELARLIQLRRWAIDHLIATESIARAVVLAEILYSDSQAHTGIDGHETLASAARLVTAYRCAGRLREAITLGGHSLVSCRRTLGDDHSQTLIAVNNLALAYESAGEPEKAIPLVEQSLATHQRILGADHPDTLTAVNNVGLVYASAGQSNMAIPLYEKNLADRKRILGEEHLGTFISANNLAFAYKETGQLGKAVTLFEQTFAARRRKLGYDHPDTLISAYNLAVMFGSAERFDEAISLHESTLAARKNILGDEHPDTLMSATNLASMYKKVGRLEKSQRLLEETLLRARRALSENHPLIAKIQMYLRELHNR
ncbi:FxSxx-COOH system tetratricopeptide repeat protein [Lentzea terrae]|uniref:FxSxx-COOH system tetratricopeptide repeat protein n=1 Tax=Lentzea terrae TaxID=2200761 RepID=UPI000DD4BEF6|nr:FxSxx-COOH system tetratricopeptide repeat protein [Lentzea terrae]